MVFAVAGIFFILRQGSSGTCNTVTIVSMYVNAIMQEVGSMIQWRPRLRVVTEDVKKSAEKTRQLPRGSNTTKRTLRPVRWSNPRTKCRLKLLESPPDRGKPRQQSKFYMAYRLPDAAKCTVSQNFKTLKPVPWTCFYPHLCIGNFNWNIKIPALLL